MNEDDDNGGKLSLRMDFYKWLQIGIACAVAYMGLELRNLRNEMRLEVREYIDFRFPEGNGVPQIRALTLKVDALAAGQNALNSQVASLDRAVRIILEDKR